MAKKISTGIPKKFRDGWSITGFEEYAENELIRYPFGMDWETNKEHSHHVFKFYFNNLSRTKATLRDFDLIADILKNNKKLSGLSDNEKDLLQELVTKGLIVIEDDNIRTTFPILFTSGLHEMGKDIITADYPERAKQFDTSGTAIIKKSLELCKTAIFELFEYNLKMIKRGLPKRLEPQAKFCARDMLSYLNNAILKTALENNYLTLTDKPVGIGGYVVN